MRFSISSFRNEIGVKSVGLAGLNKLPFNDETQYKLPFARAVTKALPSGTRMTMIFSDFLTSGYFVMSNFIGLVAVYFHKNLLAATRNAALVR